MFVRLRVRSHMRLTFRGGTIIPTESIFTVCSNAQRTLSKQKKEDLGRVYFATDNQLPVGQRRQSLPVHGALQPVSTGSFASRSLRGGVQRKGTRTRDARGEDQDLTAN